VNPDILNPEFKVGTLNLKTFESGEFCHVNSFLSIPDIFPRQSFEFAVEPKCASKVSNAVKVVVTS